MKSKPVQHIEVKSSSKGEVEALFSTFNVKDLDNDVTVPGAIRDGAEVLISAYQHGSWTGALPVGKGILRTTATEAVMQGKFFMNTDHGRNTFETVKAVGDRQEWSYGFDIVDAEKGVFDGEEVQFLKSLDVHEVSPVLQGAGIGTRTLSVKGRKEGLQAVLDGRQGASQWRNAMRPHETDTTTKAWDSRAAGEALGDVPGITDLRSVHAWCDPTGDPELKSSYRFQHHDTPGGPANLRACLLGIGLLNAKAAGVADDLPDADRRAVYNHLAGHLADGDIEPPELRSESGSRIKQNDQLAVVLADLAGARLQVADTRLTRAAKGKQLGAGTVLILGWIADEMRELKALLDSPQEDLAREYIRFAQITREF
jgi:hypothetical protein